MKQAPSRILSTNTTLFLLCLLALASAKFAFTRSDNNKDAEPGELNRQSFHFHHANGANSNP